jgi:multidrug resistance efflux pump
MAKFTQNIYVMACLAAVIIVGGAGGLTYWIISMGNIYTDAAIISADTTSISPSAPGTLEQVLVNVGDLVGPNTVVARVGNELLKTGDTESVITNTDTAIGTAVSPSTPVVQVIDPGTLRVVAHIDEDKGLSDIKLGDQAVFTVDAFGSKKFQGIVDEISPTARQEDVVFNISDKRQINQFDVKVRFDVSVYPMLKNGMSAKVWIYKN